MIISLLQSIALTLSLGWNLISGQMVTTKEFETSATTNAGCDLGVIWWWNPQTEQWNGYFPDQDWGMFFIPEFFSMLIWYMYPEEAYWVYCK